MKKLILFVVLLFGIQSFAQIRIQGSNHNGSVSIEVGNNSYHRDRHYVRYIRPYEYLHLSRAQEAQLYDMLYALEARRLSQRAYDDLLYRDLQRLLDRRQFRLWESRYYKPKYRAHVHKKVHHKPKKHHHKQHHHGHHGHRR